MSEIIVGCVFGLFALICWVVWSGAKIRDKKNKSEKVYYTEATIIGYKDQSTKYASPIVRFYVNNVERRSQASTVDRRNFPEGTVVPISYVERQLLGQISVYANIEDPKIKERQEKGWKTFKGVFLALASIFTVVSLVLIFVGIYNIIN